jgi:hypothetical protein
LSLSGLANNRGEHHKVVSAASNRFSMPMVLQQIPGAVNDFEST